MEPTWREVAISGYTHSHQLHELDGILNNIPQNTRIVCGFATGFHVNQESELGRRPGLYTPLMECSKLRADARLDYLAHFTLDLSCRYPAVDQVRLLYTLAGSWISGIQINTPKINLEDLRRIVELDADMEAVYPLGRTRMRQIVFDGVNNCDWVQRLLASGVST